MYFFKALAISTDILKMLFLDNYHSLKIAVEIITLQIYNLLGKSSVTFQKDTTEK